MTSAVQHCATFAGRVVEASRLAVSVSQSANAKKPTAKNLRARSAEVSALAAALDGASKEARVVASELLWQAQKLEGQPDLPFADRAGECQHQGELLP